MRASLILTSSGWRKTWNCSSLSNFSCKATSLSQEYWGIQPLYCGGLYGNQTDSGFNRAGGTVYPAIARYKTSSWAWSTWRNSFVRYDMVRVNCDCVQKEAKLVYLAPAVAEQFTEVFMTTDGLQFVGIVGYVNLASQGFNNITLRPQLWDLGALVGWCISEGLYTYVATIQSGPKMSPGFKQSHCLAFR